MAQKQAARKGFYFTTFMIGLGFFTMGLMDPLYDTYVPIFLGDYTSSNFLIGSIMTLDNIFAVFLIPFVSAYSDRTRTPIGRRMPYILVTLPLSAILFSFIPFAASVSLWTFILVLFGLNVFKQAARGPVVALMPDTIPGEYRSEANGVINMMSAIAAVLGALVLGTLLIDLSIELPIIGNTQRKLPFIIAGFLVVVATLLLFIFVKEKNHDEKTGKRVPIFKSIAFVFSRNDADSGKPADRSAVYILLSLFFWFLGYQGVLPFIGRYNTEVLGVSKSMAAISSGAFAIGLAGFAIISGIIAHRIGRKRTIRIALAAIVVICLPIFFHLPLTGYLGLGGISRLIALWVPLFLFGAFWSAVITNSFPMLWQMATYETMGIYTGLYYTFSQAAAIIAPPTAGFIMDAFGFRAVFIYAGISMAIAFLFMRNVRSGEPDMKPAGEA